MTSTDRWRYGLFAAIVIASGGGYAWMVAVGDGGVRGSLGLLTGAFVLVMTGVLWYYRHRLTARLVTANLALGAIVHLAIALLIVATDRLWERGLAPTISDNWHHFVIGALAVVGAFVTWTVGRGRNGESTGRVVVAEHVDGQPEPPPPPTAELEERPDWDGIADHLSDAGDGVRLRQLRALQRIVHALEGDGEATRRADDARRIALQELLRLRTDAAACRPDDNEDDVLSQAASLLEWGAQKLPELAELDVSDLLMAKVVADIRSQHSAVRHVFVGHHELKAIHPIDRATAEEKCEARAEAAREALPLLEANGMRLSEELIAAHEELAPFKSVTGFQVVELLDGGYVTFEGNGRREALQRAFGDRPVQVEVRLYTFDDPEVRRAIDRRTRRVRRMKGVDD